MSTKKCVSRAVMALAAAIALNISSAPASAQSVELRLGTGTPPSHVWTRAAERLATQMAERTDGEVRISVFPASQLGAENDLLQQIQVGVVDMGVISAAAASARAPAFLAWFSPFALGSVEDAISAASSGIATEILGTLEPQGIRGVGYVFAGMRHILMADKRVASLEDLGNQKIRITPFPGMQVWWSAAGAVPTPVQLGDVYQSLESGLLDGVDIDLDALAGLSLQQVAGHLVLTNHMAFPGVVMIGAGSWNKMSAEQQAVFNEVLGDTLAWAADLQITVEKELLEKLEAEIEVSRLENAGALFAPANEAFNEAFSSIPEVVRFQNEIAGQ
ncbi:MAG: TRAP transporter substrate-binding protein [Pikeienuella sp.]